MQFPYIVRQNLVIIDAHSPHFAKADQSVINLTLTLADAERGPVEVQFSAQPDDPESHGRELFAYAIGLGPSPFVRDPEFVKQVVASRRYTEETKGIVVNGIAINTERSSQGLILGAALEAFMDPDYTLNWKTPQGFIPLNAPTVLFIAKAIRAHVQACFNREAVLVAALDSNSYNDSMIDSGWPS
jgi:hypothetical protein